MPITFVADRPELVGTKRSVSGTATFDSSYPTGGEPVTPALLGLAFLSDLDFEVASGSSTTAYIVRWDRSVASPKAMVYFGDYNNAADAAFLEVPNTTDLSALTVRFTATGV